MIEWVSTDPLSKTKFCEGTNVLRSRLLVPQLFVNMSIEINSDVRKETAIKRIARRVAVNALYLTSVLGGIASFNQSCNETMAIDRQIDAVAPAFRSVHRLSAPEAREAVINKYLELGTKRGYSFNVALGELAIAGVVLLVAKKLEKEKTSSISI